MKTVINSHQCYLHEQGRKDGLPIIFIHGFPFSSEMWKPQLTALPADFHAVAYDIRGLGNSDVGDGQYTIELFVDDLFSLMDFLSLPSAILCGLSMGGYIAQRALQRNPERIKGLILCNTKSEADTNQAKINRARTIQLVKAQGVHVFAEGFLTQIFSEVTIQTKPEIVEQIRNIILGTSSLGLCGVQLALASRIDTTDLLPSVAIPTLLIAGQHDSFAPPAVMEAMHQSIRNSEFHVLPHSAHMSNLEDTELFNDILLNFLKKF